MIKRKHKVNLRAYIWIKRKGSKSKPINDRYTSYPEDSGYEPKKKGYM